VCVCRARGELRTRFSLTATLAIGDVVPGRTLYRRTSAGQTVDTSKVPNDAEPSDCSVVCSWMLIEVMPPWTRNEMGDSGAAAVFEAVAMS